MKYPRFKEVKDRLNEIAIGTVKYGKYGEVSESINVEDNEIVFSSGKDGLLLSANGQTLEWRDLGKYYTRFKEEITSMVESMEAQFEERKRAIVILIEAATQDANKETVLAQMSGEAAPEDIIEHLKNLCNNKFSDLWNLLSAGFQFDWIKGFEIDTGDLKFQLHSRSLMLRFKRLFANGSDMQVNGELEELLDFYMNFPSIKDRYLSLATKLSNLDSDLAKEVK